MTTTTIQPIPFRYPGGKYYALGLLRKFWSGVDHDEYREPFAGGATIFFNKSKSRHNWLNDIDRELMTTYRVMKSEKQRFALIEKLSCEVANKERWQEMRTFEPTNDLEIAYKYYYMNRTSFSGKLSAAAWGYRPKRSVPPERWHEKLDPCGYRLRGVKLTCSDFEDVIAAPPAAGAKSKVLLYVDPPYFAPPKNKHYRAGFTGNDHRRLSEALQQTSHYFFLTYDDSPAIRTMYDWANIHDVKFTYRVENSKYKNGKRRAGLEIVITNYDMPKQRILW